jgi:hypothetical protein
MIANIKTNATNSTLVTLQSKQHHKVDICIKQNHKKKICVLLFFHLCYSFLYRRIVSVTNKYLNLYQLKMINEIIGASIKCCALG